MLKKKPLVTVLMPVYNCELYVKEAVKSILSQTFTDFEFLIIDDASTDNTLDIIKEFNDSRIQLIEKPKNTGYTNSLNYGLSIAKGKYIARMDGDDISLPERFSKQVGFLEANPEVVVCGTAYRFIGSNKKKFPPQHHDEIKIELLKGTCFGHPTVMIRNSILKDFSINYDIKKEPAEDYALWVRLLKYGKLYNLQEVLLDYRVHAAQVSQKRRKTQLSSKIATRLVLLKQLNFNEEKNELNSLRKVILSEILNFDELLEFVQLKDKLLLANSTGYFIKKEFKDYLKGLEESMFSNYFIRKNKFFPKMICDYLKVKKSGIYRLTAKKEIKLVIKSLFFYTK